ncbi:hypothetical protein O181_025738 [Austropuccinia psidii MF-1]|uniref:Reverse transcriptase domain-containing protein n=1 Tax=Austropuccinia psidii MF-1 TaxID=1389203 RepID=A0A9Q3GZE3_9BASI|nr:hypothetical protein [Austropuccinia psidii MF-1]
MGIFLDIKVAYPLVHKDRLIYTLERKGCPPYWHLYINSFLSDRRTSLNLNKFLSQKFQIPNGLPQGSPLLITLYLLYNSGLILPSRPSLNKDTISLVYIGDITHLLAVPDIQHGEDTAREVMDRSRNWGLRYSAIFDEKKLTLLCLQTRNNPQTKSKLQGPPSSSRTK